MKDNNNLAHSTWNCKFLYPNIWSNKKRYIMRYLKGKSSLMIFDRHANLKYKYGNRHMGCQGYYVNTVVKNKKVIDEYIKKQLQENIATDQISIKEYVDPSEREEKDMLYKTYSANNEKYQMEMEEKFFCNVF